MSRRVVKVILITAGVAVGGTLIARRLGYNLGTNTVVRCRQGHLFTTIWIPGIKLKEVDLVVPGRPALEPGRAGPREGPHRGGAPVRHGAPRRPYPVT
jgi:hypothetical protein